MRRPEPTQTAPSDIERQAKRFLIGVALIGLALAMNSTEGISSTVVVLAALGLVVAFGGGNVQRWLRAWWLELATGCAVFWLIHRPAGWILILAACAPVAAVYVDHGTRARPERRPPRFGHPRYWIAQSWHGVAVPALMAAGALLGPRGWLPPVAAVGRRIQHPYRAASVRRWFHRACVNAGLHPPRVRTATETKAGWKLHVTTRAGTPVEWIGEHSEHIATTLSASSVQLHRDHGNAAHATVAIRFRDPFAGPPTPWPHRDAPQLSLWDPVAAGIDDEGQPVTIELAGHNLFLSGEPGAGKTTAMQILIATAALDPDAVLTICDGKEIDLEDWEPRCRQFAGVDIGDANRALEAAHEWMLEARARIRADGRKQIRRGDPLHVVVIDELAFYLSATGKNGTLPPGKKFAGHLRDLVQRGRAFGVIVVAATQRPASTVIPTDLRDLFAYRYALRCVTSEGSTMALGGDFTSLGYDASGILESQRGVGYLKAEGSTPTLLRGYLLDEHEAEGDSAESEVARIAARVRSAAPAVVPVDVPAVVVPAAPERPREHAQAEQPACNSAPVAHPTPEGGSPARAIAHSPHAVEGPVSAMRPEQNGHSPRKLKVVHLEMELARDPHRSLRELGLVCGLSPHTVKVHRERLGLPPSSKSKRSA